MTGVRLHDTGGWGCPHCEMPAPCMCDEADRCPECGDAAKPRGVAQCLSCGWEPCPECGETLGDDGTCTTPEMHDA